MCIWSKAKAFHKIHSSWTGTNKWTFIHVILSYRFFSFFLFSLLLLHFGELWLCLIVLLLLIHWDALFLFVIFIDSNYIFSWLFHAVDQTYNLLDDVIRKQKRKQTLTEWMPINTEMILLLMIYIEIDRIKWIYCFLYVCCICTRITIYFFLLLKYWHGINLLLVKTEKFLWDNCKFK